jgi:hypothetical protein
MQMYEGVAQAKVIEKQTTLLRQFFVKRKTTNSVSAKCSFTFLFKNGN